MALAMMVRLHDFVVTHGRFGEGKEEVGGALFSSK